MRAACYLRVSTGQQDVSNQLPAIKAWCESRGYELVEVYEAVKGLPGDYPLKIRTQDILA